MKLFILQVLFLAFLASLCSGTSYALEKVKEKDSGKEKERERVWREEARIREELR